MLTDTEAQTLQVAITQMLGGDFTVPGARLFAAALLPDITLNEALNAVGEWVGVEHTFNKITPGNINACVKRSRAKAIPSEAHIQELAMSRNLTADEQWKFRRELILGMKQGKPETVAIEQAEQSARGWQLESAEKKPVVPQVSARQQAFNRMLGKSLEGKSL